MGLADLANQFIDEKKPWVMAKDGSQAEQVVSVCTLGINLFRILIIYLKPITPALAERAETFLKIDPANWSDANQPLLEHSINKFKSLLERADPEKIQAMIEETRSNIPENEPTKKTQTDEIDIDQFSQVDLRVAEILEAKIVDGADKLLELKLSLGKDQRTVFSGIRSAYKPEDLKGRLVLMVANLKPRKMRFGTSEGMVLAGGSGGKDIYLLSPDSGAEPGMKVR